VQLLMTAPLAPEAVVDQYEGRRLGELVAMCDVRGIELTPEESRDAVAVRERLRGGVTELVERKQARKRKRLKLTDEERRRQDLERQILAACAEGPVRPDDVAKSIIRNRVDVRALMMELTRRGLLVSGDGYATFEAVGSC
jgi:hypothetical protein